MQMADMASKRVMLMLRSADVRRDIAAHHRGLSRQTYRRISCGSRCLTLAGSSLVTMQISGLRLQIELRQLQNSIRLT